jgi:hypothetical protein
MDSKSTPVCPRPNHSGPDFRVQQKVHKADNGPPAVPFVGNVPSPSRGQADAVSDFHTTLRSKLVMPSSLNTFPHASGAGGRWTIRARSVFVPG